MRYAILVCGPAGSGKSTFCSALMQHAQATGRVMHLFNLDPAAENFADGVQPSVDIRDLVGLEDVMEDLDFGPNGGLIYCFEYLMQNLDWLHEAVGDYEEDYLIIDCPGQIELYTHFPVMSQLVQVLTRELNIQLCATYLLESQFMQDRSKFFAGVMSAMSCMINLECPHVNILSKMDLVNKNSREMERFETVDPTLLDAGGSGQGKWAALNRAMVQLIEDYNMVQFIPLDVTDEDSVGYVLSHIDNAIQYGESEEPKEPKDLEMEGDFDVGD